LGIVTSPIGIFFVLVGVFIDAPFMKEILDEIEYLRKNRRIMGMAIALFGFVLMALS